MKLSAVTLLIVISSFTVIQATFLAPKDPRLRIEDSYDVHVPPTFLMMARPDASKEIQDAIRISKEFGPYSKQAKVAWDIVEEMDASDSMRKAFEPTKHDSSEFVHQVEFVNNVNGLSNLLSNVVEPALKPIRTLIHNLEEMSMNNPEVTKVGPMPEILANALAEAKVEYDIHGPGDVKVSESFKIAEEIVEHMQYKGDDEGKIHHNYSVVLDDKALSDGMYAVMKLEHLMRLLAIEKVRLSSFVENDELNGNIAP